LGERINIGILAAGRRVELVQAFMEQAATLLPSAKVFAIDVQPLLAPACHIAHCMISCPPSTSPNYESFLSEFFQKEKIGLIVPTTDFDLQLLANNRRTWSAEGTFVSISDEKNIELCRNKSLSGELFAAIGLRYPKIYSAQNIEYPAFLKPIAGSSSKGTLLVKTKSLLPANAMSDPTTLLMEYIGAPYQEYSIDSNLSALIPRHRIETRSGEISKGITVKNGLYSKLANTLGNWRGFRGCVTIQVFYDSESNDAIGLEVNPRFGGGFPLTYSAGANFPGWLIKEYLLKTPPVFFDDWEDQLLMLRYDAKVLVRGAKL
jgi:carbamoyl-phosphate synthase large subunit